MAERSILIAPVVILRAAQPFMVGSGHFAAGDYTIRGAGEMWRLDGESLMVPRMLCASEVMGVVDADGMSARWPRRPSLDTHHA